MVNIKQVKCRGWCIGVVEMGRRFGLRSLWILYIPHWAHFTSLGGEKLSLVWQLLCAAAEVQLDSEVVNNRPLLGMMLAELRQDCSLGSVSIITESREWSAMEYLHAPISPTLQCRRNFPP